MPKRDPTADAEIRELLRETVGAVFPGQLWEALLARLERQEGRA